MKKLILLGLNLTLFIGLSLALLVLPGCSKKTVNDVNNAVKSVKKAANEVEQAKEGVNKAIDDIKKVGN